jgi:DNA-binding transcriptional LysR family regulator
MWQTVELREIRVFLTPADELHFRRTAERLGLTQSRVSQTIRSLESKLGDQLVTRSSRSVALTTAGGNLRTRVEAAYRELLQGLESSSQAEQPMAGVIRLGVAYAAAVAPEPMAAIGTFESRYLPTMPR